MIEEYFLSDLYLFLRRHVLENFCGCKVSFQKVETGGSTHFLTTTHVLTMPTRLFSAPLQAITTVQGLKFNRGSRSIYFGKYAIISGNDQNKTKQLFKRVMEGLTFVVVNNIVLYHTCLLHIVFTYYCYYLFILPGKSQQTRRSYEYESVVV